MHLIFIFHVKDAAAGKYEAGLIDLLYGFLDLVGRGVERQMKAFEGNSLQAEAFGHSDALLRAEFTERIGSHSERQGSVSRTDVVYTARSFKQGCR